jgi:hypothetical protein
MKKTTPTAAVTSMTAAEYNKTKIAKNPKTNTNALTQSVIDRIKALKGCYAFRVNNGGIYDPTKKVFRKPKDGTAGVSDIIACIYGRYLSIEIKVGRDFQSDGQIEFEKLIRNARGSYIIVSEISYFEKWFKEYLSNFQKE